MIQALLGFVQGILEMFLNHPSVHVAGSGAACAGSKWFLREVVIVGRTVCV